MTEVREREQKTGVCVSKPVYTSTMGYSEADAAHTVPAPPHHTYKEMTDLSLSFAFSHTHTHKHTHVYGHTNTDTLLCGP